MGSRFSQGGTSNTSIRDKALILWTLDTRASLIGPDELVREAFDPYLFVRDAYLQNREFLLNDGDVRPPAGAEFDDETDAVFDDGLDEDF